MGSNCTSEKKNDKKFRNKSNTANTTNSTSKPIKEFPSVFFDHVMKDNYAKKDDEINNKAISQKFSKNMFKLTALKSRVLIKQISLFHQRQ